MIEAIGTQLINRPPQAIIDFVTDLETYKLADYKIGNVLVQRKEGNQVFMRHDGSMRGLPGPPVSLNMTIHGLASVKYASVPTFPSKWVLTFNGGFDLVETPEGTLVTHTERFLFYKPFVWLAKPFLQKWLNHDIQEEMARLKHLLEVDINE